MWILRWRNYKHSKLATFISVIGALTLYGGVMLLVYKEYVPGIVTAAVGIAIQFGAEKLAQAKAKKLTEKIKHGHNEAKKCPHCGKFVSADTKFCNYCGFALIKDKICQHCGKALNPADNFCRDCGNPYKK